MPKIKLRVEGTPSFAEVTPPRLLDGLNTGSVFIRMHQRWIHFWTHAAHPTFRKKLLRPTQVAYREASVKFRELLCGYVNLYIETGREPGGAEVPARREFGETLVATLTQFDRPPLMFRPDGLEVFLAPYSVGEREDLLKLAEREAARFLMWLFVSDWRNSIVKCRHPNCGLYKQIKTPSHRYKHGTYCRDCSSANSATRITAKKWAQRHERRLRLAGKAYGQWERKGKEHQPGALKNYIAHYVNQHQGAAVEKVTPKWVTRNWRQIELQAEKLEKR